MARFSPAIEIQGRFLSDLIEVDDSPIAVFNIHYRSKGKTSQFATRACNITYSLTYRSTPSGTSSYSHTPSIISS